MNRSREHRNRSTEHGNRSRELRNRSRERGIHVEAGNRRNETGKEEYM